MSTRIDIAVSELGASTVLRGLQQLADASQKLSPSLAASLRGRALRVGLNLDRAVKDVAVAVLDKVVHTTPHDTGQARRNWQVAVRAARPINKPLEETDYDGDRTVAEGTAIIRSTTRAPGQAIFISNSLPYIQRLNEGWSQQQATPGFVERAMQAGIDAAQKVKILDG
jgi:hypothetical protein